MFFGLSQALAWLVEPASWIAALALAGVLLSAMRRHRAAMCVHVSVLVLLVACFYSPLPGVLMRPLEQAFPAPVLPGKIAGIVLLGGAEDVGLTHAYGSPQLNAESERVLEFAALARRHPEAKLVFSGGAGYPARFTPADITRRALGAVGFDAAAMVVEGRSRNTHESAVFTREVAGPAQGEHWVLITSASHMPRAYGAFTKAGWAVIPYPVSYRAMPALSAGDRDYDMLKTAVREWIGIAVYRLTGRM